jgi:hypothetical protein
MEVFTYIVSSETYEKEVVLRSGDLEEGGRG